jgi:hypothetical protein
MEKQEKQQQIWRILEVHLADLYYFLFLLTSIPPFTM